MKRWRARCAWTVVSATLLGACLGGGSDVDVELGRIYYENDVAQIDIESAVTVGQMLHINVVTLGGGCVHLERTDVEQRADRVEIYPFDTRPAPDAECTRDLRFLDHAAVVTFSTPGTKIVEVFGRGTGDAIITIPFSVEVSP